MTARTPPTSYSELGLSPGADRGAVDRAYRALMKLHHPDRGGDPSRAAAINRAYAEITRPGVLAAMPAPDLATAIFERRLATRRAGSAKRNRGRGAMVAIILGLVAGAMWIERDALATAIWDLRWRYFPSLMIGTAAQPEASRGTEPSDSTAAPIRPEAVDRSVALAYRLLGRGGLDLARDGSERCYHGLVTAPSFAALDACLALDDAVVLIAGSAAAERGGFGAVALTARQLAAGRAMGGDYSAIEDRLDRVRLMILKRIQPGVAPALVPPERSVERPSRS